MKHVSFSCLLLFSLLLGTRQAQAQDPLYSQFYASPIILNPAFTGATNGPRAALNFRNQWNNTYLQYAAAVDMPLHFLGSRQGVGLAVTRDEAGGQILNKTNVLASYSYEVMLNKDNALRAGISGGFEQASVAYYKLIFPDQIDARNGAVYQTQEPLATAWAPTRIVPDVNFGLAYYNKYAFAGFSASHLTEPKQRFSTIKGATDNPDFKLWRKYALSGGIRIPLGDFRNPDKLSITPTFLYMNQGRFNQLNIGAYLDIAPMTFGVWYRHQDAVVAMVGIHKGPLRVGYSYDYTVGPITQSVTKGAHEISLVIELEQDKKHRGLKHRSLPCPHY